MCFYFFFRKGFRLKKALDIIYSEDNGVTDIYMCPPDVNVLTDEDSAVEDEGGINYQGDNC